MITEERRGEVRWRVQEVVADYLPGDRLDDPGTKAIADGICTVFSLPETFAALGAVMNWHEWRERWGEFMAKNPRHGDNSDYWQLNVLQAEMEMEDALEELREAARVLRERKRLAA